MADPSRGLPEETGVEVEGGAHTDHDCCVVATELLGHPALLFGCAETDPDDICVACVDHLEDFFVLGVCELSKGWGVYTRDLERRKAFQKALTKERGDAFASSIEEVPISTLFGTATDLEHEIRTIDALNPRTSPPSLDPDERHAVGRNHSRGVVDLKELGVAVCLHEAVDVDHGDVVSLAIVDPALDGLEGHRHGDRAEVKPENGRFL